MPVLFRCSPSAPNRCLLSHKAFKLSTKPKLWETQTEDSQVLRLSSLLKCPIPRPQVGVGPEMNIAVGLVYNVKKMQKVTF